MLRPTSLADPPAVVGAGPGAGVNGGEEPPPTPTDRPRKKLSFREPEILGYYMQMKQGVTSRLSRRGKNRSKTAADKSASGGSSGGTPSASSSSSCVSNGHGGGAGGVGGGGAGGGDASGAGGAGGADGNDREDEEDCRSIHLSSSTEDLDLENQAMRVVRTVGQAFEVCHKLSIGPGSPATDDNSERDSESDKTTRKGELSVDGLEDSVQDSASYDESPVSPPPSRSLRLELQRPRSPQVHRKDMNGSPMTADEVDRERDRDREPSAGSLGGASLLHHEVQLLREQLEQQVQQTQAALAQVSLLRDQLAAEKSARMEAQARTHQLLGHNRELLDHITALVTHLQEQEGGGPGGSQPLQLAPQLSSAAKVARWFELLQPPPLSRPESGFVSGAQSGDIGGSAGEATTEVDAADVTDDTLAGMDSAVRAALSRLPPRKKSKLFKLKLGRNVTF